MALLPGVPLVTPPVALHANFRSIGCRWPLRGNDVVEIWRGTECVGEVSGELLASLMVHHLVGHELVRRFDAALPTPLPRHPPAADVDGLGEPSTEVKWTACGGIPRTARDSALRAELRQRRRARGNGRRCSRPGGGLR